MVRTRNTVVLLVAASLALILWDLRASDTALRAAAQSVMAPLQRTATAVFAPLGAWAHDVQQFADPTVRGQAAPGGQYTAAPGWRTAVGRVVAADIAGDRATVTVDVGTSGGVRAGNAVMAADGLVGEVERVSDNAATVLLVTDPQSTIGVRVLPSKEMGVVAGTSMGDDLRLDVLNPAAEISPGDQVVSLGSTQANGIPPDLPVGTISAVDTAEVGSGRAAGVRPVTGMTTLETLVVLTEKR